MRNKTMNFLIIKLIYKYENIQLVTTGQVMLHG